MTSGNRASSDGTKRGLRLDRSCLSPLQVVVAGDGVAALELVLGLGELARDRVAVTLMAPESDFRYRPPSFGEPFALGHPERYRLDRLADDLGARLVQEGLTGVSADRHRLVSEIVDGHVLSVAFVVPSGASWTLPLYELAIMTARHGWRIEPIQFRPVLRGKLMTGGRDRYLRHRLADGERPGEVSEQPLWWPPTKLAGRYLSPYLLGRDETDIHDAAASAPDIAVEVPLDGSA